MAELTEAAEAAGSVRTRVRVKFEPRDVWVGLYWDRKRWWGGFDGALGASDNELAHHEFHAYVCLIPLVVIHLSRVRCPRPRRCRHKSCWARTTQQVVADA